MSLWTRLRILWRRLTRQGYFFVGDDEVEKESLDRLDRFAVGMFEKLDRGVPVDQIIREAQGE